MSCLSTETDIIKSQILSVSPSLSSASSLKHHKWCKVQSLVYQVGLYVLIQRDDMTPKFGKIHDVIYVCESHQILFLVEVFEGYSFSIHYNAFVVRSTSNTLVLDVSSIQDHHPLLAQKSFDVSDHNLYVIMPSVY